MLLVLSLITYSWSLLPIPTAKRAKRTGGKTPEEEANSPDSNEAPEDPDGNALDEDSVPKHTDVDSNYSCSDAGNVSGSDTSVVSDEDDEEPGEEFDENELGDCGELESINCHDKKENWTPTLSLSESVSYATMF